LVFRYSGSVLPRLSLLQYALSKCIPDFDLSVVDLLVERCLDLFYVDLFICLFLLAISLRPPIRSSQNLSGRWQIGCSRKVKLLVSELFQVWDGGSKGHFPFGPSFTKCNMVAKRIYLPKKERYLVISVLNQSCPWVYFR